MSSRPATTLRRFTDFVVAALALVPTLIEYGGLSLSPTAIGIGRAITAAFFLYFVGNVVVGWIRSDERPDYLSRAKLEMLVHAGALVIGTAIAIRGRAFGMGAVPAIEIVLEADLGLVLMLRMIRLFKTFARARVHHARVFGVSFVAIILVGATLLWALPGTRAPGRELSFVDALFEATSATCVTGLVVKDTGTDYSLFGQSILLFLIQVGGLGLMTFTAFFALVLGQGFGLKDRVFMRDVLDVDVVGRVGRVLVAIVTITLIAEAGGALLLMERWGSAVGEDRQVWYAVFHSVSAFCNAGFSLTGDSLVGFRHDGWFLAVVSTQIIVGGIGFVALLDLLSLRRRKDNGRARRLGVQTRIVLISTAILLVVGALFVGLFESLGDGTAASGDDAIFQSVTARTAGFNTVDQAELELPTQVLTMLLMTIGASPGSTGGGLKTVTMVVIVMTIWSFARGRRKPEIFGRSLPFEIVSRALVVVVSYVFLMTLTLMILAATESGIPFRELAFEVSSAFGTVGLTMGATAKLSTAGKLVISVAMLVGRIGPLSLVVAMAQRKAPPDYDYPEARLMIG